MQKPTDTRPSLHQLQQWMRWIITEPNGVQAALKKCEGEPRPSCLLEITDAPPISIPHRLSIYAEGYFSRIVDAILKDFPAVARVVGTEDFRRLIAYYLIEHPSRSTTLAEAGESLPQFLKSYSLTEQFPYLPDLANLEWVMVESFYADDLPLLDPKQLEGKSNETWATATLSLDSSVRLISSRWPIDRMVRCRQKTVKNHSPRNLLVYRSNYQVSAEALSQHEFDVLLNMQTGLNLGEICGRLESTLTSNSRLPPIMNWFQGWIKRGVIRRIEFSAPTGLPFD